MTLENYIVEIISRVLKTPVSKLTLNAGLGLIEEWDSLKHTELVLELENEFNISFNFDELDKIITVESIINSLKSKGVTKP